MSEESVEEKSSNRFNNRAWRLVVLASLMCCGSTFAAFFARWHWSLELLTHFRVQYFFVLAVVLHLMIYCRRWWAVAIIGMTLGWNAFLIAPVYFRDVPVYSAAKVMRVMSVNVFTKNEQHDLLLDLVHNESPSVLLVMEVNDDWLVALDQLREEYPYSTAQGRSDNFGMAIYSEFPLTDTQYIDTGEFSLPLIKTTVQVDIGPGITLIGAHPLPPVGHRRSTGRNDYLKTLTEMVRNEDGPVIVMGDLNTSPWSPYFTDIVEQTNLVDSRQGFGVQASWPVGNPLLAIPIDHVLVSPEFAINDRRLGPNIGSDHYPVIADVILASF